MDTSIAFPDTLGADLVREDGAERSPDRSRSRALSAARVVLIASLFLGTLAFGGVPVWAWGVTSGLVTSALFLWLWCGVRQGELRIVWTPLYLPALGFLLIGLLQLSGHATADPIATRDSIVRFTIDFVIFFLALQLWDTRALTASRRLAVAAAGFTWLVALFAICQFFASPDAIYGLLKPRWGGWVFGPYVNHNHYAGLMEMLIPIAVCFLLSMGAGPETRSARILTAFAGIVAVASLLLSGSRGGLLSLAAELGLMSLIVWRHLSGRKRAWFATAGLAAVGASVLLFSWLDSGQIMKRVSGIVDVTRAPDVSLHERRALASDTLHIFRENAWLGTGLGSFATVYPRYRSFPSDLEWDHAHNDYLELLAETGISGAVLTSAALALFAFLAFRNLRGRLRRSSGWISLGAAVGCFGLMVHGLADFNLHIPANAAWFSFLAGLATSPIELPVTAGQAGISRGPTHPSLDRA